MASDICTAAFTLAVFSFIASPARAQTEAIDNSGVTPATVTVTPFVSLGSWFSSRIGVAIAFPFTEAMSLEAEVGYRREEVSALSAHLSVLRDLPRIGRVAPYVAGGIGLEQFGVLVPQPTDTLAMLGRTSLSLNAGGGVNAPVDDNWGVRADVRWFYGRGEHWRVFNGVTWNVGGR
jgi:opacity protein-like surface antigen